MPARLIEDEDGVHLRREVPRQVLQEHPHCAPSARGSASAKVSSVPGRQAANRYKLV